MAPTGLAFCAAIPTNLSPCGMHPAFRTCERRDRKANDKLIAAP
jgi:hypothetical protein